MNTFTKAVSITLSLISLAYLPSVAAEETSSVNVQSAKETIVVLQETSVMGWPKGNGGIEY